MFTTLLPAKCPCSHLLVEVLEAGRGGGWGGAGPGGAAPGGAHGRPGLRRLKPSPPRSRALPTPRARRKVGRTAALSGTGVQLSLPSRRRHRCRHFATKLPWGPPVSRPPWPGREGVGGGRHSGRGGQQAGPGLIKAPASPGNVRVPPPGHAHRGGLHATTTMPPTKSWE